MKDAINKAIAEVGLRPSSTLDDYDKTRVTVVTREAAGLVVKKLLDYLYANVLNVTDRGREVEGIATRSYTTGRTVAPVKGLPEISALGKHDFIRYFVNNHLNNLVVYEETDPLLHSTTDSTAPLAPPNVISSSVDYTLSKDPETYGMLTFFRKVMPETADILYLGPGTTMITCPEPLHEYFGAMLRSIYDAAPSSNAIIAPVVVIRYLCVDSIGDTFTNNLVFPYDLFVSQCSLIAFEDISVTPKVGFMCYSLTEITPEQLYTYMRV